MNLNRFRPVRIAFFGLLTFIAVSATIDPLALAADDADVVTVRTAEGKLYTQPVKIAPVMETLEKGVRLMLLHQKGEWYAVSLPDLRLGWIHESIFAPERTAAKSEAPADQGSSPTDSRDTAERQGILKVDSGRVRGNPSIDAELVFGLSRGDRFTVLAEQGDWYHIQARNGQKGWIHHSLFDFSPPRPTAAEDESAETTPPPMESDAPADPTIAEIETADVAAENDDADTDAGSVEDGFQVVVKVRSGRVRTAPSTASPTAFGILRGTRAEVAAVEGEWYRILLPDGRTGWAHETLFDTEGRDGADKPESRDASVVKEIEAIVFDTTPEGHETITVELNSFNPPKAYTVKGKTAPLVVCEFADTRLSPNIGSTVPGRGELVKAVSVRRDGGANSPVRIEAAIDPRFKYSVDQFFFKKENRYVITFKK